MFGYIKKEEKKEKKVDMQKKNYLLIYNMVLG
jgi:hypothetical protein